jgi:hypothetical protein
MEDLAVTHRVEDIVTLFPARDDIPIPQNGQLLRQVALFDIQASAQVIYPRLCLAEGI